MQNHFLEAPSAFTVIILWISLVLAGSNQFTLAEPTNQLSLAVDFPKEKLSEILLPQDQWHPFPTISDRHAWQALPQAVAARLISLGEESLAKPFPPLPATLYLGYARNGNRSNFEAAYFERRALLQNLVLAECVEGKRRFLDAAADALWALCEESTWCVPAHVGAQKARVGLPDINEPIVDLFAGESGVTVAWAVYLLGPELDRISPQVHRRAQLELQGRVLIPVIERNDFGWMALNVTSAEHRPNNWTPWIAASVLTTALLTESDSNRRVPIVHKMLRSLDGFLRFYPADGSCDEGPSYWGRAGGSLLDCLDILHSASGGKLNVYANPLIQEIGRFIYRAYIAEDYFVPIGDCPARFQPERDLVFRFGQRIGDSHLKSLAAHGKSVNSLLGQRLLGRQIYAVFDAADLLGSAPAAPPLLRDVWLPSDELQLMTARSQAASSDGWYVAAWGAHNAQSHNHNDVGNFLVFADGQPVFVDVGAPTYTAQTFSSKRYEIWAFQSAFHNLPTINGVMQSAGRAFAARDVLCQTNDAFAQLQLDIAPAYPPAARVKTWLRTVRLNRDRDVEITEAFELTAATGETSLNLMSPLEAEINQPGRITLHTVTGSDQRPINIRLEFDDRNLVPAAERIDLTDDRLAKSWGTHLNRLILRAKSPALRDTWRVRIVKEPKP